MSEKVDKNNFVDKELQSFIDDLRYAMSTKKHVLIYATGTYKGISGIIQKIDYGTIVILSQGKRVRIKISDIKRIEIFEEGEQ